MFNWAAKCKNKSMSVNLKTKQKSAGSKSAQSEYQQEGTRRLVSFLIWSNIIPCKIWIFYPERMFLFNNRLYKIILFKNRDILNKFYPFMSMCTAKASAATPRITVGCAHMACGLNSHLIYVYDSNKLHGRPL